MRPDKLGVLRRTIRFDEFAWWTRHHGQRGLGCAPARDVLYTKPPLTDADGMRSARRGIVGEEDGYSPRATGVLMQGLEFRMNC